jgi:hypothetical protein
MAAVFIAFAIQITIALVFLGALIYVIVKRVESKRNENFEDRDN